MKMLFHSSFIFLSLLILLACSNGNSNKSVDLDQIRPKSEFKSTKDKKIVLDSNEIFLNAYKNDSIDLKLSKIRSNQNTSFLIRFPHENSGLRTLMLEDTSIQLEHEFYKYADSNQMKNAFFNWLDCNGKDCRSIKVYEETKIETQNLLVIATDNSIDFIRGDSYFKPKDWIDYIRFSRKSKDFKYILFQKKNQKAKWFEFKDYKLVPKTIK